MVTQGSFVLSNYANDQLQQDIARDKLVSEGQMTQEEADEAAEEWETVSALVNFILDCAVMERVLYRLLKSDGSPSGICLKRN